MDNNSYSNGKNKRRDNDNNSYTAEPHYEDESEQDFDDIFANRNRTINNVNPKSSGFKVTLPDNEDYDVYTQKRTSKDLSAQSRVPKGKPVAQKQNESLFNDTQQQKSRTPKGAPVKDSAAVSRQSASYSAADRVYLSKQNRNESAYSSSYGKNASSRASAVKGKSKKKNGGKGKKFFTAVVAILLVLLLSVFAYGYSILGKINYDTEISHENQYISSSELASSSKVRNILFIGSDYRDGEVSGMRSDTMMLFSIDKENKKIKLTSFLRDSYVCIPSTGNYRKLNAACSSGGAQLVIDTIEYNFKIKIDDYVLVDFEAFTNFIDALGGLDIDDVTAEEAEYLHDVVKVPSAKEGSNHFTGGATLWYCRIRYLDDDFHRTERQRKVISALLNQIKHTNPATLMSAIEEVMPLISTDISRNSFLGLGVGALTQYLRYDIEQQQIPAEGTWSNLRVSGDGLVLKMDIEKNTKILNEFLYSDDSDSSSSD